MDRWGIEKGLIGVGGRRERRRARHEALPRPLHRLGQRRPEQGRRRHPRDPPAEGRVRHPGQSASSRPARFPRSPSTTRSCTRSTPRARSSASPCSAVPGCLGPRSADGAPAGRAHRRGHVRLPRADVRDPARLRAVGGPGGQAHAQVARACTTRPARSPRSTTPRRSSTTPTPAAPTRSSTPATSRWACRSSASSPSCADVPFKDEVWPKFLRTNALRVLGLDA